MIDWQNKKFKALVADGNELECEILHAFESVATGKNYLVYTDGATDENGAVRFFASSYTEEGEGFVLTPVESDAEWEIIEKEVLTGDR